MNYQINDIIYTKDGRKIGNLLIVDITESILFPEASNRTTVIYTCVSDYGNMIRTTFGEPNFSKQFFKTPGKATSTHKYYNYKQIHPEMFI